MNARAASVSIERVVDWSDTDAAGHYHHSSVIRWVEAAEAAMQEQYELGELFGHTPRVHYEVDYLARLWFRDRVQVTLVVAALGRSSIRYEFEVRRRDELAVKGAMVAVYTGRRGNRPVPWTPPLRQAFLGTTGDTVCA